MNSSVGSAQTAAKRVLYYDAHNHLQDEWLLPHRDRILRQLQALPIAKAVVNATNQSDWRAVSELAERCPWVIPSFGIHPWWVGRESPDWPDELMHFLTRHPDAGVGEIGLDRWMLDQARPDDPRLQGLPRAPITEQQNVFTLQLQIAVQQNRVATLHCLEAWGAMWEVLRNSPVPARGFLLHAYSGPQEMVAGLAKRGAYFSFNGAFLGERKERQKDVFRRVPLDRLLVETDAPAMSLPLAWRTHKLPPEPSGQPLNHPGNIEAVYAGLAALRGLPAPELSAAVAANFRRLFG